MEIKENRELKPFSHWRVGGPADYFCRPQNSEELKQALLWAEKNRQKVSVIGGGTNVLISDEGVEGLVISTEKLSAMTAKEEQGALKVTAEAGVLKSSLGACFRRRRLLPALFLSGLPGDVGGGVVMNAGAGEDPPCEFSHITEWFEVMTGKGIHRSDLKFHDSAGREAVHRGNFSLQEETKQNKIPSHKKKKPENQNLTGGIRSRDGGLRTDRRTNDLSVRTHARTGGNNGAGRATSENTIFIKRFSREDVQWKYRGTFGWRPGVVFRAGFSWPLKKDNNLNQKIKTALKRRRATQPLTQPSCGSVFKNPPGGFAGELIEKSGLKGFKKGAAVISEKHGNFIVNLGGAAAGDIDFLIQKIRTEVKSRFNIPLEPEVHYLGRWRKP